MEVELFFFCLFLFHTTYLSRLGLLVAAAADDGVNRHTPVPDRCFGRKFKEELVVCRTRAASIVVTTTAVL